MTDGARKSLDPLTQASVTVAWIIVLNKPFYPVYVWYLAREGAAASLGTLIATPFFAAIPFIARRSSLAARVSLPLVGTVDTLFETKLFGPASGTELFYAACILLVAVSFKAEELWWQRCAALIVFLIFVYSRNCIGTPLSVWDRDDLSTLLSLNAFAVAGLTTFIALRSAGNLRAAGLGAGNEHQKHG
ncbi:MULTISPECIES: hypothetical protein [unclassified Rhizobium]|uniref:hypothetical protein n=1 Tax=unclassified Rhizobium TaxID=2613769 RepID=UPI00160B937C|nr:MULTISPECIES: hypothetical protein [unclassified Rhizobium]MBB3318157.1 hypothetical protein [Rhizobium sp. BK181]MBB3543733.1 hypothetical protein [Rhizobium sp. BK399]MCS3742034.1 hypothetical protein [Rhizobium sp. BK661]MCS4093945.1 hypothetical protein [Rhizobium sp. BK176]